MTTANLTRDETAARAAVIHVDTIAVELDLREAQRTEGETFPTTATLTFTSTADATWIDFLGASVDEVVVNGVAQPVEWDGARIAVSGLVAHNVVTVRGHGRYSTSGEGLHRFRDPVDGETYLYTQYEPADCRRVYPCFEQPDLKARWTFTVSAPAGWQVLSNGAEASREDIDGGVRVSFAETLPLSSYITAVAAGPYARVDGVWAGPEGDVPLGVLCRVSLAPHLIDSGDAAEILDITRRGLTFYSDAFGIAYPWGTYDQIFVPEYNLGAMENPGLVTFTERYVFRGAATLAQHEGRANTILHEMAHMWFGDLATMRWWDDLWLKESFADFMGAHAAVVAGGFPDAWVTFASRRKGWAYAQDQLPTTHPIVADIPDLEAAKLNFDGITYAKGAAVLKQLVAYVGEDAFFAGARRYFSDHAYGNTTLDDLLNALEAVSGRDLRAWSAAWLETTGMSQLDVERGSDGELSLIQTDPRPHRFTVGVFGIRNGNLVLRDALKADIAAERTGLPIAESGGALEDEGALIVPNVDDRTYAKVRLDAGSTDAAAAAFSTIDDPLVRAVVWAALWDATRDGELPVARYLDIVSRHAPAEPNAALLADAVAHAGFAVAHYAAPEQRGALATSWLETTWAALHAAAPGSDAQLTWARALGGAADGADARSAEIRAMLDGALAPAGLRLDPELRWAWLTALSATGHATAADADAELAHDETSHGRVAHRAVLAARLDETVRATAWRSAWQDASLTNEELDATIAGVRAGASRRFLAPFDAAYFAGIREVWQERSIEIARRLVIGLFPASDDLGDVDAWLEANGDAPGALRRLVIEQRDGLARRLRVRAAQPSL